MTSSTKATFCYLVQGQVSDIDAMDGVMQGREWISLTWDRPRAGSIHLPKSTWSEGRRKLCHEALNRGRGDYIIFMDGDALTTPSQLATFEDTVRALKPAVAVPRVPKTERFTKKIDCTKPWVLAYESDEQFQCFDARILTDHLGGSPYVSEYDQTSWWYPCVLNQRLIRKHYWRSFIQVNGTVVSNDAHGCYPNSYDARYILNEARRLGVGGMFPLSAGGRFVEQGAGKWALILDKRIFVLMSWLSPWLYKPFDPSIKPRLHANLRRMIK